MSREGDKILFEVYRQAGFDARYRVVYFTELDENNRENEIDAALDGEHFYDGFLHAAAIGSAKSVIAAFVHQLNEGATACPQDLDDLIGPFKAT